MAPALTKTLKDGHGIHLSSPPAALRMDPDDRAVCSTEPESRMRPTDDGDLQKLWLNLSRFPSLDSRLPAVQASASRRETVLLLPAPASLLSLLSFNKGLQNSHQVAGLFPGVPDMFIVPVPEHNSQEAFLLHGRSRAPECGPDGGDVHRPPLTLSVPHGEINSQGDTPFFATPPPLTQGKVAAMGRHPPSSVQPRSDVGNPDRPASGTELEAAAKEKLSRQAELQGRAQRLQRRLQALLGEHAVQHCSRQLEGLKRHRRPDSPGPVRSGVLPPRAGSKPRRSWPESFTELTEFSRSSQAVLRGLQEALDSEATASSSSDEEDEIQGKTETSPVSSSSSSSSCEARWLEERAELGSRWSWLQLRLAELEGRMQQPVELHKHIRSTKGGVVLAESQPLTDRQIQQTLLREMAGLSDADTEPCSPTRLLHNIERQSAQLSQIVSSLMPPLSFSPLSKQPHAWKGQRAFTSGQTGDGVFEPGSSKRRTPGTRRLSKADASYVCARTRPLVTYHKPKLFTFNSRNRSSPQDSGTSSSAVSSSSLSSSSCSRCSSCDPVALRSDPDYSSGRALSSRTPATTPHPGRCLSFDAPRSHHLKRVRSREEWSQRPLSISVQAPYSRRSSTPLHNSHTYKQHARHHERRVVGLSPIRMAASAQSPHRRANQRKRKRRHIHRLIEDEDEVLYQFCDPNSSDEVLEESYTPFSRKKASRGFVRKRQGESVYNIDNIVIPMSLAKVEKLQYKDILTPSWRENDASSLTNSEAEKKDDNEEEQVEDLTNKMYALRHLDLEQREKLRWSSWGKRTCCRLPRRSGSRLSAGGGGGGMCSSGDESSVELSCAQLDSGERRSSEEWLPQTPWEPRVFPLAEDEEDALLSDHPDDVPSGWPECSSASSAAKNSSACLSLAQSSGATPPSGGQSQSSTSNGS